MPPPHFPDVDFTTTPISKASGRQLAEIARGISRPNAGRRTGLRDLILANVFDSGRGLYVPLSPRVNLPGKLPDVSKSAGGIVPCQNVTPFPASLFTNPLLIPPGYERPGFNAGQAPKPKNRATNAGFVLVTIEFDCREPSQFDENLAWTRSSKGDGDFANSPFADLDRELRRVAEYRGFSIVFSGNKSLHFHFVFSTSHLANLPYQALGADRIQDFPQSSALMQNAHRIYWDHVHDTFAGVLAPSMGADRKLRSYTQWRRAPWGIRLAEEDSVLGFSLGTPVPQLVIRERLLQRAPKGHSGFLVPELFSLAHPVPTKRQPKPDHADAQGIAELAILDLLGEACFSEWGEWPKPAEASIQNGEWLFRFRNHAGDRNPSTIVLGNHRRLLLNGRHEFGDRQFFLPDGMTAQDLGNHLAERLGWRDPAPLQNVSISDRAHAIKQYRSQLAAEIAQRDGLGEVCLIQSVEGIGKTTACLSILANDALEDALAHDDGIERFSAFSFRSRQQAEVKAGEFGRSHPVRHIKPFWSHYEDACAAEGVAPMPRDEFDDANPGDILLRIRNNQPGAFDRLERTRAALWQACGRFDGGATLLCVTHKAAQLWHSTVLTRAWHHPEFEPLGSSEVHTSLRGRFLLTRSVFDDCEVDDFVHVLPEPTHAFLERQQGRYRNWRNTPRPDRLGIYRRLHDEIPSRIRGFESFDEFMRLDLESLEQVTVDFEAIPFGFDNGNSGIYRSRHGDSYYIGPKPWLHENTAEFTFLTTESLVAKTIETAFKKVDVQGRANRITRKFILDDVPPIYPVKVPVHFDPRASANRLQTKRISALAEEIAANDPNALIIADGVRGGQRAISFQKMKGQNDFQDKNVTIIPTCLAPEKYAELNIMGQWLGGVPDIIDRYYDDQLNQAVGRNRGFRQSNAHTTTRVITSPRLWNLVFKRRHRGSSRTHLYLAQ